VEGEEKEKMKVVWPIRSDEGTLSSMKISVTVIVVVAACCAPTILLDRWWAGRFAPLLYWPGSIALVPFWYWTYEKCFTGIKWLGLRMMRLSASGRAWETTQKRVDEEAYRTVLESKQSVSFLYVTKYKCKEQYRSHYPEGSSMAEHNSLASAIMRVASRHGIPCHRRIVD
jgi:hypothetical protein